MKILQALSLSVFSPKTHLAGGHTYLEVFVPNLPLMVLSFHYRKGVPAPSLQESELWGLLQGQMGTNEMT